MTQSVLVVCEQQDGAFRKISTEAISEGRRVADALNTDLIALVIGKGVTAIASELEVLGPDTILIADNDSLNEYSTDAYVSVCTQACQAKNAGLILIGASVQGKDLSARLAARLDAGLVMDCIFIRVDGEDISYTRPMFGGKVVADVRVVGTPQIVAIRSNVMAIEESPRSPVTETLDVSIDAPKTIIIEKKMESGDKVDLTEADIIVSGGRGTGGEYSAIESLADLLGGAVGASRSAVDEGWRPHSDQVGQTGKVVSPSLYIACGISGAIQHLAGMSSSKTIVAINKDAEAPIFSKADYGVVGDLNDIVPEMIEEIRKIKT